MDFLTALKYPFNSIAKVFSIVLAMTIALALCLALIANAYNWSSLIEEVNGIMAAVQTGSDMAEHQMSEETLEGLGVGLGRAALGLLGLVIVSIVGGFWISGYSVAVIRAVMDDPQGVLPAVEFGRNMRAGFTLFLSAVVYGLLFLVYLIVVGLLSNLGGLGGLIVFVAAIAAIPFLFVMGWGYYIGMARYAAGDDPAAVFQILENMKTARVNLGSSIALVFWQLVLTFIYRIGSGVLDSVINGIAGSGVLLTALVISAIVFFALNLFQHFSAQHLIAQYAMQLGIGASKPKT